MSFLKNIFGNKKNKKEIDSLFMIISKQNNKFTQKEVISAIKQEGYSKKIANKVLRKLKKTKGFGFREENKSKTIDVSKDKPKQNKQEVSKKQILAELSGAIKKNKTDLSKSKNEVKEKLNVESKKVETKKENKNNSDKSKKEKSLVDVKKAPFYLAFLNFFRKVYFFFEDKYYDCIDFLNKKNIKLNKITDKIDKVVPSFVVFLLILVFIFLLIFGVFSFSKSYLLTVEVSDTTGAMLNGASVVLQINDENVAISKTDVFGETMFSEFKAKGDIKLIVSKEYYYTKEIDLELNKKENREQVVLDIDTELMLLSSQSEEKTRNISFVENNDVVVRDTLNVSFYCSNSSKTPIPKSKIISTGYLQVKQVSGCGDLRVSVTSSNYRSINNKLVPENNKVILTRINSDTGKLNVNVTNLDNIKISDAVIKIYNKDISSTPVDESLMVVQKGNSDVYGSHSFEVSPGDYLVSVDKQGYLFTPKKGPFNVLLNQSTSVDFVLFTAQDLADIDCSLDKYAMFCENGEIDCDNVYLQPYISHLPNGECVIGNVGYLNVNLWDVNNTSQEVFGDISLYHKPKDENVSYQDSGISVSNSSNAHFDIVDLYDYRIIVSDTEDEGYISPDPYDVSGIDQNVDLYLEYSSELNSGDIGVSVKNEQGYSLSNSKVYLFREFEDEYVLVNNEPEITNNDGDVNFYNQRANKDYYAYAINSFEELSGESVVKTLDANEFLEFFITMGNSPSVLNLEVNVNDYDINFYNSSHTLVTNYVTEQIEDSNTNYIFYGEDNVVYAKIRSEGYSSYQTDYITLYVGQTVYKSVTLTPLNSCEDISLQFVGLFDESGQVEVEAIDFDNFTLDDTYKLKFRYLSCYSQDHDSSVMIKTGNSQLIDNDFIYISDLSSTYDLDFTYGYAYSGELEDWNSDYFLEHYESDLAYTSQNEFSKFAVIDFSFLDVDELEFSVDVVFSDVITDIDEYTFSYKALLDKGNDFDFDPILDNYENWTIVPEGYFYSPFYNENVPFDSDSYIYNVSLETETGFPIYKNGDFYNLFIDNNYNYILDFIYLKDQSVLEDIHYNSEFTSDNLEFLKYSFDQKGDISIGSENEVIVNNLEYIIPDVFAYFSYYFTNESLIRANGFFDFLDDSYINSNVLDLVDINLPIRAYTDSADMIIDITTEDVNGSNNFYVGKNNASFSVYDNFSEPVSEVEIYYKIGNESYPVIGQTNSLGLLENIDLNLSLSDLTNGTLTFVFVFDSSYGIENNEIEVSRDISSGILIGSDLLEFNAEVIEVEDEFIYSIDSPKDYLIYKYSEVMANLNSIIFNSYSNNFDDEQINLELEAYDNKIISESLRINAPIYLDLDNVLQSQYLDSVYRHNIILSHNSSSILLDLDLLSLTNLNYFGRINILNNNLDKQGYFINSEDDSENVELINLVYDNLDLEYIFNLENSSQEITLEGINVSSNASINLDLINNSLNNLVGNLINDLEINIPVEALDNPTENGTLNIDFDLNVSGDIITVSKEINIFILDKNEAIEIKQQGISRDIICNSLNDCSTSRYYGFVNHTQSYNFDFDQVVYSEINPDNDLILEFTPINLESSDAIELIISGNFEEISGYGIYNEGLDFTNKFTFVQNPVYSLEKEDSINVYFNIQQEPFDPETGITGNFCIGSGSYTTNGNLFIIGNCLDDDLAGCNSGQEYKPKVIYNWSDLSSSNLSWSNLCTSDVSEYDDSSLNYCDSVQAVYNILSKTFSESLSSGSEFYIYLLRDGTSIDLLKDIIDYENIYLPGSFTNKPFFSEEAINEGRFTINKDSIEVGLYKVRVTGDFEETFVIDLEKIQDVPSYKDNVYYHLPIDGMIGVYDSSVNPQGDNTREGYGAEINYINSDNLEYIPVTKDLSISLIPVETYDHNPVILNIYNRENGIESSYFETILKSEGNILNLNETYSQDQIYIDLDYMPSIPVPVYVDSKCNLENNLNYVLKENENDNLIRVLENTNFLEWILEENDNFKVKDTPISSTSGIYQFHSVDFSNYSLEDLDNVSGKTIMYVPVSSQIDQYKLSLDSLGNDVNTYFYSLDNLEEGSREFTLNSKVNLGVEDFTLEGLIESIGNSDEICISNSVFNTSIRYNDLVDFSEEQLNIIKNSLSQVEDCSYNQTGGMSGE